MSSHCDENPVIWVSGSKGFIGRHLIDSFGHSYGQIRCFTNNKTPDAGAIYMDFSDAEQIREAVSLYGVPDIFIHLGWGATSDAQSHVHSTSNILNSKNLINQLYRSGLKKFILLGSISEYGDREGPLSEEMLPVGVLTKYAEGKSEVSSYGFEAAKKLNRVFLHIRLAYTFGSGQYQGSLINQLYRCYLEKSTVNLSPCEQYRDYIYISDVVCGIKLISGINESEIVNLGSGRAIQLKDFVNLFWKHLGGVPKKLNFGAHPKPGGEPMQPYCFSDLNKLKRLINWVPSITIEEGIKLAIKELKNE